MKKFLSLALTLLFAAGILARAQNEFHKYAFDNFLRYSSEAKEAPLTEEEKEGLKAFREMYSVTPYRSHDLRKVKMSAEEIVGNIDGKGRFKDLDAVEEKVMAAMDQEAIGLHLTEAFIRVWKVAEEFRAGRYSLPAQEDIFRKLQKAIIYYGKLEVSRSHIVHRFHASCFAIPTAAVNTYFCFYDEMETVEAGKSRDKLLRDAHDMLMVLGLHAWTQPLRNDFTDGDVVQVERFRNHIWWVGGNALAYRSLLPVAAMYSSVEMIELMSEVAQRAISRTSQHTFNEAFWTEGCTEDGAGWGHGKQCLVWGYPIDGNISAMTMLTSLKDTPWEAKFTPDNVETLMNFIRGSNWFYYKGHTLPFLSRNTTAYDPEPHNIRTLPMVMMMLKDWADFFSEDQKSELRRYVKEAEAHDIRMNESAPGIYHGTRWFFNNDDLIKKNDRYHIFINMASVRCDGLESAKGVADGLNLYPNDGMTLFQKTGNEYAEMVGAWDITATPGVTAREGMDRLVPVTNWRGYCSKHNFAGAATDGGDNAVAGYIFEKMNASTKENVNDRGDSINKNKALYGVKAYKSYFIMGDYLVALGAGITNMEPEQEGTVRTTIDNTRCDNGVLVLHNGETRQVKDGEWSFNMGGNPVWVVHEEKFSYTVLPEYSDSTYFCLETLKTDWVKFNGTNARKSNLPSEVKALRLWKDHGREVKEGEYGYAVYAGDGIPSEKLPFRVLNNDTYLQAVESADGKVLEAVFYDPGVSVRTSKGELCVSHPCVVLLDGDRLSVTDPTMSADIKVIKVTLNGADIPVEMPRGGLCGKSVTKALDFG